MHESSPALLKAETPRVSTAVELFYQPSESIFGAVAADMVSLGWSVFPQLQDRRPARVFEQPIAWAREHDLRHKLPTPEAVTLWSQHCATANVACVFGPASSNAFALDIDVLDPVISERIVALADEHMGRTPLQREGMAPKIALIYRASPEDAARIASTAIHLAEVGVDGVRTESVHAIEIQGAGKLLTFHGRHHRTGRYFKWLDTNPLAVGPSAAPLVTPGQVEAWLSAVEAEFPFHRRAAGAGGGVGGVVIDDEATSTGLRVPRLAAGGSDRVADGRFELVSRIVFAVVRANSEALFEAAGMGADAVQALSSQLATASFIAFTDAAVIDAKWSAAKAKAAIAGNVNRTVARVLEGKVTMNAAVAAASTAEPVRRPTPNLTVVRGGMEGAGGGDAVAREKKEEDPRPLITLTADNLHTVIDRVEAAVVAADRGLYQRNGGIVYVSDVARMGPDGRIAHGDSIVPCAPNSLLEHMSASCRFQSWDGRKKDWKPSPPTKEIASILADRNGRRTMPILAGFINAPTLRFDGSILDKPGYDARSGLIYNPRGAVFPAIPEAPSKAEAEAALAKVAGLLSGFPFVADHHRSGALSMMLAATVRRSLPSCPLHGISANTPGTGKSYLADLACRMVSGHKAATTTWCGREDEDEKRLSSHLMAGRPVVSIDNVQAPIGGAFLNSVLTQEIVAARVLGKSEMPELSTNVMLTATGNNLRFVDDMDRRVILVRLDAKMECPETRTFAFEPDEVLAAGRGEYLVAALTVLRAFANAGFPAHGGKPLNGFKLYDTWIRGALVWLGYADPVDSQADVRQGNPAREKHAAMLGAWEAAVGSKRIKVSQLLELAGKRSAATQAPEGGWIAGEILHPELREAVNEVAGDAAGNAKREAQAVGLWLRSVEEKRLDGLMFVRHGESGGAATWTIARDGDEPVKPAPQRDLAAKRRAREDAETALALALAEEKAALAADAAASARLIAETPAAAESVHRREAHRSAVEKAGYLGRKDDPRALMAFAVT